MEEKTKTPVSQPEAKKADKKDSKDDKFDFGRYIKELKGEFRKIVWPSGKELTRETVTVIVVSLLVGVIIFAIDYVFNFGYEQGVALLRGLLQ